MRWYRWLCERIYVRGARAFARTWVCSVPSCREITSNLCANRRISCGADPRLACSAVHPAHFRLHPPARRQGSSSLSFALSHNNSVTHMFHRELFNAEESTELIGKMPIFFFLPKQVKCFFAFYLKINGVFTHEFAYFTDILLNFFPRSVVLRGTMGDFCRVRCACILGTDYFTSNATWNSRRELTVWIIRRGFDLQKNLAKRRSWRKRPDAAHAMFSASFKWYVTGM